MRLASALDEAVRAGLGGMSTEAPPAALAAASARTGCRVDLAGGTLDIWPLGLLHAQATTVNVAVSVAAEASVAPRAKGGYGVSTGPRTIEAETLSALANHDDARLAAAVAEAFALPPATIRLSSASPRGAGLGASSALGVALVAAIEHGLGLPPSSADHRAALVRDLEARMMGRPTGTQDHYPPLLGGALAIRYPAGGVVARRLDVDLEALDARLIVSFSGKSHISADANWGIVRRRLDGDPGATACFEGIAQSASALAGALVDGDWPEVGRLMAAEWRHRKALSTEVTTPEVDSLLAAAGEAGAWGGKVCGAGGGGCVAVLAPPARREDVVAALEGAGGTTIDASPTPEGVRLVRS